jgi:hypothetical protein
MQGKINVTHRFNPTEQMNMSERMRGFIVQIKLYKIVQNPYYGICRPIVLNYYFYEIRVLNVQQEGCPFYEACSSAHCEPKPTKQLKGGG